MANKELYHHGIKGQRWGVRRYQNQDGTLTAAGKKRQQSEGSDSQSSKSSSSSSKSSKEMTDDELKAKIGRLQLEKQYKDLLKGDQQQKLFDGKKFVAKVLEKSGENIATQAVTYLMGTAANKVLAGVTGDKNAVNPKKGQKDK